MFYLLYSLRVVCWLLFLVSGWTVFVCCSLVVDCCLMLIVFCCSLFVVRRLLFVARCLLGVYCFLFLVY